MWKGILLLGCLAVVYGRIEEEVDYLPTYEPGMLPGKYLVNDDNVEADVDREENPIPLPVIDIMPPKHRPGEILPSAEIKDVNRALDDILKSAKIMHDRSCAVGTANTAGRLLVNPRYYLRSGMVAASPPFEVQMGQTSMKLFVKKNWEMTGTVGVVTYDIEDTDHKVAIMWSVPFDFNIYDVWYNVKVYPRSYDIGKHMYTQMYYYAGPWRAEGWESREEFGVKVTTSMTKNIHSKLMVYVDTSNYNPEGANQKHAECSYHSDWVGNYCWRECHSGGYCWINQKCKSSTECFGEMPCYKSCTKTP